MPALGWDAVSWLLVACAAAVRSSVSWLALLAGVFTLGFAAASVLLARRFFARRPPLPSGPFPPITLIKPLKGEDLELYENLASFCRQDYPCWQIVFCLSTPDDPALGVVRRLQKDFPGVDVEVVVSKNRIGYNPKVNNMANGYPYAKYDLLLMSDSDIRVEPDFLKRMAAPFEDPSVGVVTSFYQAAGGRGLWGRLEALSVNAHFLPAAASAAGWGMRFAMGAAMMTRRKTFEETGGFQNLADHLADDFWLGESAREAGWRVDVASGCVDTVPCISSPVEHFLHTTRWARTIRLCQPWGFYASLLQHGFSLLTLRLAAAGPDALGLGLMAGIWAAKAAAAIALDSELGRRQRRSSLWLLPVSEWLSFGSWLAACGSNTVLWRGELFVVRAQGRLQPASQPLALRRPVPVEP